jgi:hypothetical protein
MSGPNQGLAEGAVRLANRFRGHRQGQCRSSGAYWWPTSGRVIYLASVRAPAKRNGCPAMAHPLPSAWQRRHAAGAAPDFNLPRFMPTNLQSARVRFWGCHDGSLWAPTWANFPTMSQRNLSCRALVDNCLTTWSSDHRKPATITRTRAGHQQPVARRSRGVRGLGPLTPTLPGPGRPRDQARWAANGRVGGVADAATVVTVVVKTVVRPWCETVALPRPPRIRRSTVRDEFWAAGLDPCDLAALWYVVSSRDDASDGDCVGTP